MFDSRDLGALEKADIDWSFQDVTFTWECSGAWEAASISNERVNVTLYRGEKEGEKGGEAKQKRLNML